MMFFIALGVLVAAASTYLVRQFLTGTLEGATPTHAEAAADSPRESLKAA